jgi:predicted hotdog family 3-hydroxylacyl-ACP dehydratase
MTEFDTHEKVAALVPHKGHMHLLDRVVSYNFDTVEVETEVDITDQSMFYEESYGGVPVWIGFEYMAQSVSVMTGLVGLETHTPPKMGFILSVTNFKSETNVFPAGSTVHIWVRQTVRMDMAVTFEGKIFLNDKQVVAATMNTIEVDDPKKTLGV